MQQLRWIGVIGALCCAVSFSGDSGRAVEPKKEPKTATERLMQRKLQHSQKVLEALALNDFKAISANAEDLIDISKTAEWKVIDTPQYELFSNEFRRQAGQMVKAAKEKNLDGATLAYVEMTMTCVRCHKFVREERRTQITPVNQGTAAAQ